MFHSLITLEQRLSTAPALPRYALACLFFLTALLSRMALAGALPQGFPFLTFFPAVLLSAYLAGLGPGLLVSALSVLAAWFFFFTPMGAFPGLSGPDIVALTFFSAILVIDCIVIHVMRSALAALQRSRADAVAAAADAQAGRRVLDATFNAVPASIIVADAHGKLLRMNRATAALWGMAPDSSQQDQYGQRKGWWADDSARRGERVAPQDWALARSLRGQTCEDIVEIEPFDRPGDRTTTLLSSAPVLDPSGAVVGAVVAQVDISSRVQVERALRESQQLLQSTMDNFPTVIAFKDREGRFLDANKALEIVLGRSREQLRGLGPHDLMPRASADAIRQHELQVMSSRRAVQVEVARPLASGTFHSLDTTFPLIDGAGGVYGVGHISHDITSAKLAEQALNTANEQLRHADRQKDEFLATLAHELRNPLAPIRNAVELIKLRQPKDDTVRRAGAIIERQVLHLTRLVDDLLDVSRITMGTVTLRHEELDLVEVATGAVDSVRPLLERAGLRLKEHIGPEPIPVRGDSTRLAQCMVNLLTNALKFTPRDGLVSVRVAAEGALAVIEVQDSGIGIAPDNLERIFELFVQVQRSGVQGNTGLGIGLALTRKLIALHGGTVSAASSQPGAGSRFRIELPLAPRGADLAEVVMIEPPATVADGTRVLIVDDNSDAADTLSMLLSMSGFLVKVAYTGEAAIAALAQDAHDAVLLDIGLPDIDGYEVCRQIRANTTLRQPVVLALTGWGQDKDREAAARAGFDGHLSKPVEPERLLATLQAQLITLRKGAEPIEAD